MVMRFQQQLGKDSEKTENERAADEEIHLEEEWKRKKEIIIKAAEQTIGYQPKPDRRGWFDDKCRLAVGEKNIAYKKGIDRLTRNKRQEYKRL
jgi:hypothetical protein